MRRLILKQIVFTASLMSPIGFSVYAAALPTAEELLKDADRARGAVDAGMTWTSQLDATDGKSATKVTYSIKARADQAVAETVAPEAIKGEYLIFKDRNLWFLKPGMKRAVVISARQKLTGAASNADITSTNYLRDYNGVIVGEETVDGVDCYKLELKAKAKNVSYDGIRYWVSKANHLGIKAEFLSVKGETFKTADFKYDNKVALGGKQMPFMSKIVIKDTLHPDSLSTVVISAPKVIEIPEGSLDLKNFTK